ncbi:MAG: CBS domain-containing protein [Anaerolineaceae bacterium]
MYGYVSSVVGEKGRQIYTISRTATVTQAVREMNDKGIGALLVMEDERIAGIFTERDVLRRVVDADRDPALTKVAAVMTRNPATIPISAHVSEAMNLMTSSRFRHLPVVENGSVVGMLSIGDILRWLTMQQEDEIRQMTAYITGQGPAEGMATGL